MPIAKTRKNKRYARNLLFSQRSVGSGKARVDKQNMRVVYIDLFGRFEVRKI